MNLKNKIEALSEKYFDDLVGIRNHLHKHPELSFEEFETSAYIRSLLDQWNIEYDYPIVKTGILAHIKGGKSGKVIALR